MVGGGIVTVVETDTVVVIGQLVVTEGSGYLGRELHVIVVRVPVVAKPLVERIDAQERPVDPLFGDTSRPHGLSDNADRFLHVRRHEEDVNARLDRHDGRLSASVSFCDGAHHECVRHEHAVESHVATQKVGHHGA